MSAVAERPAEFDARVMRYLPGLKKLARRFTRSTEERDDLVTDTIMYALRNWQSFREDGAFWSWLCWQMRGEVSRRNSYNSRRIRLDAQMDVQHERAHMIAELRVEADHDIRLQLEQTVRLVADIRHGDVLLRVANGETLTAIAAERGLSKERVRQLVIAARSELEKRL